MNLYLPKNSPGETRLASLTRGHAAAEPGDATPRRCRLKEVVYSLGTYNQTIMSGLWADLPYKISKKVKENWLSTLCLVGPVVGTYTCVGGLINAPAHREAPADAHAALSCDLCVSSGFRWRRTRVVSTLGSRSSLLSGRSCFRCKALLIVLSREAPNACIAPPRPRLQRESFPHFLPAPPGTRARTRRRRSFTTASRRSPRDGIVRPRRVWAVVGLGEQPPAPQKTGLLAPLVVVAEAAF